MKHTHIRQVVIIGAGNVATHMAYHLKVSKLQLIQIWSRTEVSARTLATRVNVPFITDLKDLLHGADLYILALPDHVLPEILPQLKLKHNPFIVHTAGGSSMDLLRGASERYGVFYPLQSFSLGRPVNFRSIPVCIEANSPGDLGLLKAFALHFSRKIYCMDSEKRKSVHLAAVFANNFTNYLYQVSADLLQRENLPFDLMKPLIRETAMKVQHCAPHLAQTGPAVRNDRTVIEEQLKRLGKDPEYVQLYSLLTQYILDSFVKNSKPTDHAQL